MQTQTVPDTAMADRFLSALGFGPDDAVILCAKGDGAKGLRFTPRKQGASHDWQQLVSDAAMAGQRDWKPFVADLKTHPHAFFKTCPGGTKREEITHGWLLVAEIDHYDKSKQLEVIEAARLPQPTLILDTGNPQGSYHFYWTLKDLHTAAEIEVGRKRLAKAINQVLPDGVSCDESVACPSQPMRLAGFRNRKNDQCGMASIHAESGKVYSMAEVMENCPPLKLDLTTTGQADETKLWNKKRPEDKVPLQGSFPSPADLKGKSVPLMLAVSQTTQDLITTGQKGGAGTGRAVKAHSISCSLQAAKVAIESEGYVVTDSSWDPFEAFCRNSRDKDGYLGKYTDVHQCAAHFETKAQSFGPAEVNSITFKNKLAKWAMDQGHWQPKSLPPRHIRDKSLHARMGFFRRYVARCVKYQRNSLRRNVYLRDMLERLQLKAKIRDKELNAMVLTAQDRKSGEIFCPVTAEQRLQMQMPEVEWLIPDALPAGDLNIVCGRAKVGKTLLIMYLIRCLLTGDQFLSFAPPTQRKVLLVSDDQADGDSALMMQRQGLWDHPNLIWTSKFRVEETQLDQLLDLIKQNPGLVVVVDSLRSTTRALDCSESDSSLGLVLYDLKAAVINAGGSFLLIHHANKTADAVGMEAMSGHNSIAAAANTVMSLSYLPKQGSQGGLQKGIPERRLVIEGRSPLPADLVISIDQQGSFSCKGTFDEFEEKAADVKKDAELRTTLKGLPLVAQDGLLHMLSRYDNDEGPVGLLPLLKATGHCPASVQKKSDLESDTKYAALKRWVMNLVEKDLTEKVVVPGGIDGRKNQQGWSLTDQGAELIRDCLAS